MSFDYWMVLAGLLVGVEWGRTLTRPGHRWGAWLTVPALAVIWMFFWRNAPVLAWQGWPWVIGIPMLGAAIHRLCQPGPSMWRGYITPLEVLATVLQWGFLSGDWLAILDGLVAGILLAFGAQGRLRMEAVVPVLWGGMGCLDLWDALHGLPLLDAHFSPVWFVPWLLAFEIRRNGGVATA